MTQADHVRDIAIEAAVYAIATAGAATDVQTCLRLTMGPLMPALRLNAALEHAAEIKSCVNPARIDIEITIVTRDGIQISTGGEDGT